MLNALKSSYVQLRERVINFKENFNHEKFIKTFFSKCRWFNAQLTNAFGIKTIAHWSMFAMFLAMMAFNASFHFMILIFLGYLSVIPHEYGHALMARRYGYKTNSIIIHPLGGVALIEQNAENMLRGKKEFWVAAAGPLVTLGIVFISLFFIMIHGMSSTIPVSINGTSCDAQVFNVWTYLFISNIVLLIFNLVPAYPLDGGRMLCALLDAKYGQVRAIKIAHYVSIVFCVIMALLGVMLMSFNLILIAILIVYMGRKSLIQTKMIVDNTKAQ